MAFMRAAILLSLLAGLTLGGCSVSPERQQEIQRAWAEREAEMARECERAGRRYVAGTCSWGGL
jgi:uncharacterized protein (DUF58 family)